jgi:hypothetical protein
LPVSRREVCPACDKDVHVCLMCQQFDPSAAKSCREPTVDEVKDKQRANFCDLFIPDSGAYERDPERGARQAQSELNEFFGVTTEHPLQDSKPDAQALLDQREEQAQKAQSELETLFGVDKK